MIGISTHWLYIAAAFVVKGKIPPTFKQMDHRTNQFTHNSYQRARGESYSFSGQFSNRLLQQRTHTQWHMYFSLRIPLKVSLFELFPRVCWNSKLLGLVSAAEKVNKESSFFKKLSSFVEWAIHVQLICASLPMCIYRTLKSNQDWTARRFEAT